MSNYLSQTITVAVLLVNGILTPCASAQTSGQEQAAKLRMQLTEVQAKETEQQTRLQQLDEALKPENIEASLAGVGSTHPEELRQQRRIQLEKERAGVRTQLDQLAISHTHLETAVAAADARAYQESARGPVDAAAAPQPATGESTTGVPSPQPHKSTNKTRRRHVRRSTRHRPEAGPVNP